MTDDRICFYCHQPGGVPPEFTATWEDERISHRDPYVCIELLFARVAELEAQLASTIFDYKIQIAGSSDISVLVHNDRGSVQATTIGADGKTIQTRIMSNQP